MFFKKRKALIDQDLRQLDLEMLTFLQSAVMAKLLLVNNELIRRYRNLGQVAQEMDNSDQYLRAFFSGVDRCEQINAILNARLLRICQRNPSDLTAPPLPVALDSRNTRRLLCRAGPRRTGARVCLFRGRTRTTFGGEITNAGRGPEDCGERGETAGAIEPPPDVGSAIRRAKTSYSLPQCLLTCPGIILSPVNS